MKQVITLSLFVSLFVMGCGSINTIKHSSSKSQTHYIKQSQAKKPNQKVVANNHTKRVAQTVSSHCSYIIRDLSVPHANTIWCMPKRTK